MVALKRSLIALLAFLWPAALIASPAQELAERFIDVLRHDDLGRLAKLVDPDEGDPRAWEELRTTIDLYDCLRIDRYDWSLESATDDHIALRMNVVLTGALKAKWRPERTLSSVWHIEARRVNGKWLVSRVITEERRIAIEMMAASEREAERIAASARDVDPLRVIMAYARELSIRKDAARLVHALALADETGDVSTRIRTLAEYNDVIASGDPPRGIEIGKEAETLARTSGSADDLAEARMMLGLAYLLSGDRDRAYETYSAAGEMVERLEDPATALMCIQMRSYVMFGHGSPIEQLRNAEHLLELARRFDWEEGESLALFNHVETHWQLGNLDVVRADSLALMRLAEAQGNRKFLAYAIGNLANLEMREQHYARAVVLYRRALALFSDGQLDSTAYLALGRAETLLRRFSDAEKDLAKADALKPPDDARHVTVLTRRSRLQLARGRAGEAIALAREALQQYDRLKEAGETKERAAILHDLSRALRASGRSGEAIDALREAIGAIESREEQIGADALGRVTFLQDYADMYVDLIELLVARNRIEEAFRVAEQMKGRGLREAIAESRVDLSASMSAEERAREETLQKHVAEINRALLTAPSATLRDQLAAARVELDAFRAELRLKHPALQRRRVETLREIALPSNSMTLIEYVLGEKQLIAFVVRPHAPLRAVRIPIARDRLRREARELELLIAARSPAWRATATKLHDRLIAPVERFMRKDSTVVVVPDGELWTVPFHALLIDRYTVFYAHSLALLRNASTLRSDAPSYLLALGNPAIAGGTRSTMRAAFRDAALGPLPDAENEVRALAALYPSRERRVYYGAAASETLFKSAAPRFRVIHVAAHAVIDDRAPMYSAIALAPGDDATEDGLLEAREVVDLPLNADLAILSACQTARGKVHAGEGVLGLSWAFFAAGCPTTVVSQWNAESTATAQLMIELHRQLRHGTSTAAALRAAQLSLRQNAKYAHPFYWAPFVAIGAAQ